MRKANKKKHNKALIIQFLLLFTSLVSAYHLYKAAYRYAQPIDIKSIPLIERSKEIFKTQPLNASGLVIPHQNKTVYNNLRSILEHANRKTIQKNSTQAKESEEEILFAIRDRYLKQRTTSIAETSDPFALLAVPDSVVIFFGFTSTKEAAETRAQRLSAQYPELRTMKFQITKNAKAQYTISSSSQVKSTVAEAICRKINKINEICHVKYAESSSEN